MQQPVMPSQSGSTKGSVMFSTMKISAKLSALVAFLVSATLVVGLYSLYALNQAYVSNAGSLQFARDLMSGVDSARAAEVSFKIQIQEFKNVLLRGQDPKDYERYLAAFKKRNEVIGKEFDEAQAMMKKLGMDTQAVEDARRMQAGIFKEYLDALQLFQPGKAETTQLVDARVRGKDRPLEEKIEVIVTSLGKLAEKEGARLLETAAAESQRVTALLSLLLCLAVLVGGTVGVVITRSLRRELGGEPAYAREVAGRIAQGELSFDVQVREGDTRSMLFAMKEMAQNLRNLVGEVAAGAHTVSDTSAQIAQGNVDLSQRTEEQASTLEETASSMEELTTTVTQNAQNARQASQLAVGASDVARKGGAVVGQVVDTMSGISESSRKIADIISVIDGIAFQTNILALNAAVEAARAGEQGRGFAVVAAEVRNLAQRSAAAAKEIKVLIGDSVEKVEAGTRLVDAAGRTMEEIVTSVKQVTELIAEIAAASQEQSSGIEQVNTAVNQMDQVVQQNASLVEEATAATESMKEQAGALLQMVSRFKLGAETVAAGGSAANPRQLLTPSPLRPAVPAPIRVRPGGLRPLAHATGRGSVHASTGNGAWKEF